MYSGMTDIKHNTEYAQDRQLKKLFHYNNDLNTYYQLILQIEFDPRILTKVHQLDIL